MKKGKDILYIVIPAYNEEENIAQVIEEWYKIIERHDGNKLSRLVVVDDGSRDKTRSLIEIAARNKEQVEVISKQNEGHGSAVIAGYEYALARGADFVFQTDSDRQTNPKEFEGFWRQRNRFDAVIGNRFHRNDGRCRIFAAEVLKLILAVKLHVWIPDANTPYRLMKNSVLTETMKYIEKEEKVPNVMISVLLYKKHRRVLYRDISFNARSAGKNKLKIRNIVTLGIHTVKSLNELSRCLKSGNTKR